MNTGMRRILRAVNERWGRRKMRLPSIIALETESIAHHENSSRESGLTEDALCVEVQLAALGESSATRTKQTATKIAIRGKVRRVRVAHNSPTAPKFLFARHLWSWPLAECGHRCWTSCTVFQRLGSLRSIHTRDNVVITGSKARHPHPCRCQACALPEVSSMIAAQHRAAALP